MSEKSDTGDRGEMGDEALHEDAEGVGSEAGEQADPSENCDSACSSCAQDCSSRTEPMDMRAHPSAQSTIKHALAVVSGKGGVGKTLVTSMIAAALNKQGHSVGILDADITGPSIPKAFGIEERIRANVQGMLPSVTQSGIQIVSTNLLLPEATTPVIWRGGIISSMVKQFYSEVLWGDIDYLLIDMPPGTGDVPLTVYQSISIDGVIVVTAPQDLVSMIVGKAINMAIAMEVPVLGIIENMSFFECPDCGSRHEIFGASKIGEIAEEYDIDLIGAIPILPDVARLMDAGRLEDVEFDALDSFISDLVVKAAEIAANESEESEELEESDES